MWVVVAVGDPGRGERLRVSLAGPAERLAAGANLAVFADAAEVGDVVVELAERVGREWLRARRVRLLDALGTVAVTGLAGGPVEAWPEAGEDYLFEGTFVAGGSTVGRLWSGMYEFVPWVVASRTDKLLVEVLECQAGVLRVQRRHVLLVLACGIPLRQDPVETFRWLAGSPSASPGMFASTGRDFEVVDVSGTRWQVSD